MSSDCGYQGNGPCPLCEDAEPLPEVSDFWKWIQGSSCIPYQDDPTPDELVEVRYLYQEKEGLWSQVTQLRTANTRLQSLADEAIKERDKAVERELVWTARAEAAEANTLDDQVQGLVQKLWNENQNLRSELQGKQDELDRVTYVAGMSVRRIANLAEDNTALRVTLQGYEDYVDQLEECFKQIDTARHDLETHQEYLDDADVEDDDQ